MLQRGVHTQPSYGQPVKAVNLLESSGVGRRHGARTRGRTARPSHNHSETSEQHRGCAAGAVLDAGNFKFDSPSNHWPWAADVAAEEAFDGSDGGLSRETLEASDSQVSYVPSPSSNHLCTLICWFSWQYSCVSRMSSINEVLPHQSPAVQPQPLGTQARALCWYAAMPPRRRLAADSLCFACRCRLSATSSSPMYCKVFGGTSGSSAGSKD